MMEINTILAGLFYILAGCSGLIRHFLLKNEVRDHSGKAPHVLLATVFSFSVVMVFAGLHFLSVWFDGEATVAPPGATGVGALLAFVVMAYKFAMLYDTAQTNSTFILARKYRKE